MPGARFGRRQSTTATVSASPSMPGSSSLWSRVGSDARCLRRTRLSRGLKALSKEFDVPVLARCQLNREPDNRPSPGSPTFANAGALEQDADLVNRPAFNRMASTARRAALGRHRRALPPRGRQPAGTKGAEKPPSRRFSRPPGHCHAAPATIDSGPASVPCRAPSGASCRQSPFTSGRALARTSCRPLRGTCSGLDTPASEPGQCRCSADSSHRPSLRWPRSPRDLRTL